MITNQRQYLNTQAQAERFRQALAAPDAEGLHPKAAKAMRDGLRSQLEDLETELAEYDALRQGRVATLEAESIVAIGEALIKARIVRNLTQKELAERLSLAEQQIQRYEATQYRGVAAERLQQVADALELRVREVFTLEQPEPTGGSVRARRRRTPRHRSNV
jgi:HTH-type transcriptional regulator/antitoxin HigA